MKAAGYILNSRFLLHDAEQKELLATVVSWRLCLGLSTCPMNTYSDSEEPLGLWKLPLANKFISKIVALETAVTVAKHF